MPRAYVDTPLGSLQIECVDGALCRVWLPERGSARTALDVDWPALATSADRRGSARTERGRAPGAGPAADEAALAEAARQFAEYFAGTRTAFTLRLDPRGTPFQRAVWDALLTIPYGVTWSYAQLAAAIGRPRAVRAVGLANGANPLAIVIPCHRVIGSDGRLTGYGGGLPAKRYLLDFERSDRAGQRPGEFSLT